ncbi:MAG: dTDP-4-dehydrorhamnose reductase [Anaerolineae bacterium]|nr:dTDP-4-dehydrorhamnose reductase [Anaerolineae bacterium]
MRVWITGANGRLGSRLMQVLTQVGHNVAGVDVETLDVTDWVAVRAAVRTSRPEVVIHAAAWTDVDGCAREPERAYRQNGLGAGNVAAASAEVGAMMVYISTNEVFDGQAERPYWEYDAPRPINPYGASKWAGEQMVMRASPRHQIVRTAWLFAHGGKNFIQSILGAAQAGKPLRVVTDEIANPTYTDDLATAVVQLMLMERAGVYHAVNAGAASRYDFARYVLDHTGHAQTPIEAITHADWARPSTPPLRCALDNHAAASVGVTLRPWQAAVEAFLRREGLWVG